MRLRTRLLVAAMLPLGSVWAQRPAITSIANAASYYQPPQGNSMPGLGVAAALLSQYSEITCPQRR